MRGTQIIGQFSLSFFLKRLLTMLIVQCIPHLSYFRYICVLFIKQYKKMGRGDIGVHYKLNVIIQKLQENGHDKKIKSITTLNLITSNVNLVTMHKLH